MGRFSLIVLALLAALPGFAGSRYSVAVGVDGHEDYNQDFPAALFSITADAPHVLRKHIPLEFAVGYIGPYKHNFTRCDDASNHSARYWTRAHDTYQAVRLYTGFNSAGADAPLEAGLGLSCHQFWMYEPGLRSDGVHYLGERTQWRGQAHLGLNIVRFDSNTFFLEADIERALTDHNSRSLPLWSAFGKLGWHFRL